MILVIDNYDSFTYNLVQYIGDIKKDIVTKRNDETSLKNVKEINPSHIVISPGPGKPENAGNIVEVIQHFYQKVPILGVCLGHQAIGFAFGGEIVQAKKIMHGKVSNVNHFGSKLFLKYFNSKQLISTYIFGGICGAILFKVLFNCSLI